MGIENGDEERYAWTCKLMDSNEDEDKRRRRRIDSRIWPKGDYTKEREKDSNKKRKEKNIQLSVRVKQGKGGKGAGGVQRNNLIPREREQRDRSDYSTRQTRLG